MKTILAALFTIAATSAWAQTPPPNARPLEERVAQLETAQAALTAQVNALQKSIGELLSLLRAVAQPANAGIPLPSTPLSIAGAPARGSAAAPIVIVEYSDFQCPYCAAFTRETLPALLRDYVDTGAVQFVFRHLPLDAIHPRAIKASAAAECAFQQNKFWEMHNALFADQGHLDDASLDARARNIGLQPDAYAACMKSTSNRPQADARSGFELHIGGTPTFLVGTRDASGGVRVGQIIEGNRSIAEFKAAIDKLTPAAR